MATKSSPNKYQPSPRRRPKTSAPHPVLQNGLDDYRPQFSFRTDRLSPLSQATPYHYSLELHHQLNCPSLQQILLEGRASLITRTHCAATRRRLEHVAPQGPPGDQVISLDASEHQGQILHQSFIVSEDDALYLPDDDWNPALRRVFPGGTLLRQGAILAVSERSTASTDEASMPMSLIDIEADLSQRAKDFNVSLNQDRIKILLNPADFQKIKELRSSHFTAGCLYPSVYLIAVLQAVLRLHDPNYEHLRWHQVINTIVNQTQPGLETDEITEQALTIAQDLIEHPLSLILPPDSEEEDL